MAISVTDSVSRTTAFGDYSGTTVSVASGSFDVTEGQLIVLAVSTIEQNGSDYFDSVTASKTAGTGTVGSFTSRVFYSGAGAANADGGGAFLTAAVTGSGTATITAVGALHNGYSPIGLSIKPYLVTGHHASPIGATGTVRNTGGTNDWSPALLTSTGDGRTFYCGGYFVDPAVTATSSDTEDAYAATANYSSFISAYKASDHSGVGSISGNIVSGDTTHLWGVAALEILAAGATDPEGSLIQGKLLRGGLLLGGVLTR